jgi:hypothetical protein
MRIGAVLLVVWLAIGAVAAGQRHYYSGSASCVKVGTIALTIAAGPSQLLRREPEDLVQGTAAQSLTSQMPPALLWLSGIGT